MRATITGATGLVGSNLAIELLKDGHRVRCTRRPTSKVDHLSGFDIEWVDGDLGNIDSLTAAFRDSDVVFHCAAQVTLNRRPTPLLTGANVEGTRNVLEAVRRAGVGRLVHCSSVVACAVSTDGRPVDEEARWNFPEHGLADGYTITKHQAQELVLQAAAGGLDAVVVNPTFMLGPYDPRPSSGKMIVDVVEGRLPVHTPGYNNFVDVRDVCRGMVAAWLRGRRGERYILGNENLTYREMMERIARVAGVSPPRIPMPRPLATVTGWLGDLQEELLQTEPFINSITVRYAYFPGYRFSSDKAKRELGYQPGPVDVAVRDALRWFRERGMIRRELSIA